MFVTQHISPGDTVADATAGNGHDTLFLAKLVGATGTVHSFDIQQAALDNTKALLKQHGLHERVELHLRNHQDIAKTINGPLQAVMFNFGYLPGGDKGLVTSAENSLTALNNCLAVLGGKGVISAVTYSGHPGGAEEEAQVAAWCKALNSRDFNATCLSLVNKENNPPKLWMIQKLRAAAASREGECPSYRKVRRKLC